MGSLDDWLTDAQHKHTGRAGGACPPHRKAGEGSCGKAGVNLNGPTSISVEWVHIESFFPDH